MASLASMGSTGGLRDYVRKVLRFLTGPSDAPPPAPLSSLTLQTCTRKASGAPDFGICDGTVWANASYVGDDDEMKTKVLPNGAIVSILDFTIKPTHVVEGDGDKEKDVLDFHL